MFVMIIIVAAGTVMGGVTAASVSTAVFADRAACSAAGDNAVAAGRSVGVSVRYVCERS